MPRDPLFLLIENFLKVGETEPFLLRVMHVPKLRMGLHE